MDGMQCQYCDKEFSSKSNLNRHHKNVHFIKGNAEEKPEICEMCGKSFSCKSTLNRHHRTQHASVDSLECDKCNENFECSKDLYRHKRSCHDPPEKENRENVACPVCSSTFSSKSAVNRHLRTVHETEPDVDASGTLKCPLCPEHLRHFADLDKHLENKHNVPLEYEEKTFSSVQDFEKWKREVEEATNSFFTNRSSRSSVTYFRCHRSGDSRLKEESSKMRWAPLLKVGQACPARMTLRSASNGVTVEFHKCHIGHDLSVKHLRLTKEERVGFAGQLQSGVPMDTILDQIRQKISSFRRVHGVEKKDLHNIVRDFKLDQSRLSQNDFISTDLWVQSQLAQGEDMIKKMAENTWEVKSSSAARGTYLVQPENDVCDGCPLACPKCRICVHQFDCSCVDYTVKGNFCKHIHACIRSTMEDLPTMVNDEATHNFEEEAKALVDCDESLPTRLAEVDKRQKLKVLLDRVYALSSGVPEDGLDKLCAGAEKLLSAALECSGSVDNFGETPTVPANKKIEHQRFHSVRKKKPTESKFKKPESEEKEELQDFMRMYKTAEQDT